MSRESLALREVAVVIPALNQEECLRNLLPQLPPELRVVVVDNDSSDNSSAVAASHGAKVVFCPRRGYGSAVRAGLQALRGDALRPPEVVAVLDADGSSPVSALADLVAPIMRGDADLVIAQRHRCLPGAMRLHTRIGNWLTVGLIFLLTGYRFRDVGPLRALRWGTIDRMQLHDPNWGWNVEMQIKAALHGLNIQEIPTTYHPRRVGGAKISGSLFGYLGASLKVLPSCFFYTFEVFWQRLTYRRQWGTLSAERRG